MKRLSIPAALVLSLMACGQPFRTVDRATSPDAGSSDDASPDAPSPDAEPDAETSDGPLLTIPAVPTQPKLEFRQVKTIHLSWSPVEGAAHYQLLEAIDDNSPLVEAEVESPIEEASFDHVVPLWKRAQARYAVKACNAAGCSAPSPEAKVSFATVLNKSIGYIKASNTDVNDRFGSSMALSEDGHTLVVGAAYEDSSGEPSNNSVSGAGAAYVLVRRGSMWEPVQYLKPMTPFKNGRFGASVGVSADGSTVVVGAPYDEQTGSVYVFTKEQTTWTQQAKLKASNLDIDDEFGASVALTADGNALVVGAPAEDGGDAGVNGKQSNDDMQNAGAAYQFVRSNGTWKQATYIKSSNRPWPKDRFGLSVAISRSGSRVAIGTPDDLLDLEDVSTGGSVYVLRCSEAGCTHDARLGAPSSFGRDFRFGAGLAFSGDEQTLAVGAPDYFEEPSAYGGAVFLFAGGGGTWVLDGLIRASNRTSNAKFGASVAFSIDGDVLLVGAPGEPSAAQGILLASPSGPYTAGGSGAVYVLVRRDGAWSESAFLKAPNAYGSSSVGDSFGSAVAISGDGATLASSAPNEASASVGVGGAQSDDSAVGAGAVYLY